MRKVTVERKTLETEVFVDINLDGECKKSIDTGIKFFNHMLEQIAAHGFFDVDIKVTSHDKDPHHIVEDVALTLGEAIKKAVGNKKGINRYGSATIPMDEALALTSLDLSGRPYCVFNVPIAEEKVSDMETNLVKHFFISLSTAAMMTIHIKLEHGEDTHHKIEAVFKSFARALNTACSINEQHSNITPSSKGSL